MRVQNWRRWIIIVAFTTILVGYFVVWLPHSTAGLTFIGIDIGEWLKFLPGVRSGELGINRNAFYLPPVTLSLMMLGWSFRWPVRRWHNWAFRFLALSIALVSLPSFEAVTDEPAGEWLARFIMVSFVIIVVASSYFSMRLPKRVSIRVHWFSFLVFGLIGAIFPTITYLMIREPVSKLLKESIGIGPGVWLNAFGHLLLSAMAVHAIAFKKE